MIASDQSDHFLINKYFPVVIRSMIKNSIFFLNFDT